MYYTKQNSSSSSSSETMGLTQQAFSPMKERIDENHPWATDDDSSDGDNFNQT